MSLANRIWALWRNRARRKKMGVVSWTRNSWNRFDFQENINKKRRRKNKSKGRKYRWRWRSGRQIIHESYINIGTQSGATSALGVLSVQIKLVTWDTSRRQTLTQEISILKLRAWLITLHSLWFSLLLSVCFVVWAAVTYWPFFSMHIYSSVLVCVCALVPVSYLLYHKLWLRGQQQKSACFPFCSLWFGCFGRVLIVEQCSWFSREGLKILLYANY